MSPSRKTNSPSRKANSPSRKAANPSPKDRKPARRLSASTMFFNTLRQIGRHLAQEVMPKVGREGAQNTKSDVSKKHAQDLRIYIWGTIREVATSFQGGAE
jgi:hypothetical protein